jgi:cob(I)alamin adenosyltransferase
MIEKYRQTGRTSRIINHIVEQLFSVGECLATDHTSYEYENIPEYSIDYFIEKVENKVKIESFGSKKVEFSKLDIDGKIFVKFKLKD